MELLVTILTARMEFPVVGIVVGMLMLSGHTVAFIVLVRQRQRLREKLRHLSQREPSPTPHSQYKTPGRSPQRLSDQNQS